MQSLTRLVSNTKLKSSSNVTVHDIDVDRVPKLRKRRTHNSDDNGPPKPADPSIMRKLFPMKLPALQIPASRPLDNFTRYDQPRKSPTKWTPEDRRRFFGRKSIGRSTPSLVSPESQQSPQIDPFSETQKAQRNWATPGNFDGGMPTSNIRDIDWSQFDDAEAKEITSSFNRPIFVKSSPVDSALDLPFAGKASHRRKGKGSTISDTTRRMFRLPKRPDEPDQTNEEILEEHYEAVRAYEARQDENDEEYARDLAAEVERQRLEREEADRIEAERLQEEERRLQEEEERRAEELAKSLEVECICCGTSKAPGEYSIETPGATCEHPVQTCIECTQTWLASELESNGFEALKCPQCPSKLEYTEVQRCASAETFASYEKFVTRAALSELPNFTWCQNSTCDSGQLNEENHNYMKCMACNYQQCVKHNCAWHTSESCATYEYRESGQKARDDERATEAMLNTVSKMCPGKNCGWRIQKTDGCDHMTCRRCRHEFCWQCLAAHAEIKRVGNTAHAKDCSFHSDNLATSWPFNAH